MYDLTVSNVHTFAVGDNQYVVHNSGCTEEAVVANTMSRSMSQEFGVKGGQVTIAAAFFEDPATGALSLRTSMNQAGLGNAALRNQVAQRTEAMGGTFVDTAYGANGHAELNIVQDPAVAGQTLKGIGASNYICNDCGNGILAATGGNTDVIGTPIKAPGIKTVKPSFRDPTNFSFIPDYQAAPGDGGIIEGLADPWVL
jgi:hypothetical protein